MTAWFFTFPAVTASAAPFGLDWGGSKVIPLTMANASLFGSGNLGFLLEMVGIICII